MPRLPKKALVEARMCSNDQHQNLPISLSSFQGLCFAFIQLDLSI